MRRHTIAAWLGWGLLLAGAAAAGRVAAADPPPQAATQPGDDAQRQKRIDERDRIDRQVRQHLAAGQWSEAVAATLEMLAIERELFGEDHADTDGSCRILAETSAVLGDFDAARRYAEESLARHKRLHGEESWQFADAQDRLRYVNRLSELEPAARTAVAAAVASYQRALQFYRQGNYQSALEPIQQALETLQKQLANPLGLAAACADDLGQTCYALQKYEDAARAFRTAADTYDKATGPATPPRAGSLQALGAALREQQKFEEAIAAFRQAAEIREKLLGADHADTRKSLSSISAALDRSASALEENDQLDAARKQRQEVLELRQKMYPEGDWRIVDAQLALARNERLASLSTEQRQRLAAARKHQLDASANYRQDKAAEALKLCQAAYDARREILGEEHQDTAICANLLGLIHNSLKDFPRGESMLLQAAAIWKKVAGPEYPEVSIPLQNLADSYEDQSRFVEAKKLTEEAWHIRAKTYGDQDEDTRRSLASLLRIAGKMAAALEDAGNWPTAEVTRREMVDLAVRLYGERDWRTTDVRLLLAAVQQWAKLTDQQRGELKQAGQQVSQADGLNGQGKGQEAEPLILRALATRETLLGTDAPATSQARQVLIAAYRGQGKYAEAEKTAQQLIAANEKTFGTAHPRYAMALELLGHVYYNQDQYQAANERYRAALAVRRQAQGERDTETINAAVFLANSLANLAAQLEAQEDFTAAIAAREQAAELQQAARGPDAYQTLDARFYWEFARQLAALNAEQRANLQLANRKIAEANRLNGEKKFNAAVEVSEDAVRLRKEVLGDKHRLVGMAVFLLGVHVQNRGDAAEALRILLANEELLKSTLSVHHPDYAYTQAYIAGIDKAQNHLDRAVPRLRIALEAYARSYGEKNQDTLKIMDELVACLQQLSAAQWAKSDAAGAKVALQEVVALHKRRYGEKSPQAIDAAWALYRAELWPSLKANQRKELLDSDKWMAIAEQKMKEVQALDRGARQMSQAREVIQPAGYAVQLRQQVLGDNPATADALELLAAAQTIASEGAGAIANYQKALAMRRKTQGETHPAPARTRSALVSCVASAAPRPFERPSKLTAAQKKRLVERDRLAAIAEQQALAGQFEAEYRTMEQILRIEIEVYGDAHEEIAATYERFINRDLGAKAWQQYRTHWVKLGEVRKKLYGPDSWQAVEARVTLANFDLPNRLNEQQANLLQAAWKFPDALRSKVSFEEAADKLQPALEATEALRKALLSIVGENHLYYANCLEGQAAVYRRQGNEEEADALLRKAAEIVGRVLTTRHPMYATRMNNLAQDLAQRAEAAESEGDFEKAYEWWRKRIDLLTTLHGAEGWQVVNARLRASQSRKLSSIPADTRALIAKAINRLRGSYVADPLQPDTDLQAQTARVALLEKHLGPDDLDTMDGYFGLARQAQAEGRLQQAAGFAERAIEHRRQVQGANHPATARNANYLGLLWYLQADYAKAEPRLREAQQILEKLGYTDYPVYALYLNNLAVLYEATGDFDRAEPLLRAAVNVKPPMGFVEEDGLRQESFEEHVDDNEILMGQFNLAEILSTPNVGVPLREPNLEFLGQYVNNLALLSMLRGDYAQGESLLRQSLDLMRRTGKGDSSTEYLNGLTNLAAACERQGNLEQAELLAEYVVQEYGRLNGQQAKYAVALNNLGAICLQRGDAERSVKLRAEALQVQRTVIGERHPTTILTRANLALLADRIGHSAHAATELDGVLDIATANLQLAAAVQSERQQLRMNAALRGYLDRYLSVAARAGLPAEQVYKHVLAWKGMIATRQRQMRSHRRALEKDADPQIAKIYQELAQVNQQLAALSFGTADEAATAAARGQQLAQLSLRKDELERDLSSKNAQFDRERKAQRLSPAELKGLLPPKSALVDLVEYEHTTFPGDAKQPTNEQRIVAFVVRPDVEVARIELGPAEPIDKLVDACRQLWIEGRAAGDADPAVELRKRLWQPIADQLNDVQTVLVSPDGAASRVPFAALPGNRPETYLLEDVSIAILPVPQLLGELAAGAGAATNTSAQAGLLLMGDVDFDAEPGSANALAPAAARDGQFSRFGPLPGTLAEVQAVGKLFSASHKQPAKVLEKAAATEDAFRQQAAGAAYLHLATHGFFAPPTVKRGDVPRADFLAAQSDAVQTFEGWNPGLLSGIVLAGVNRPLDGSRDDGIVTAAEVADLNLSQAQLVVLSACETGLGQIAGGEGALGLQRAFQVAGARSVVSSLWKVDDAATQLLMTQFYENLWVKKLPPLAAFRQAQLSLLNGKVDTSKLRGLDVAARPAQSEKQKGRLAPRLWAAFVVSGGL